MAADGAEPTINVWSKNNSCMICQETCGSADLREKHEDDIIHKRKFAIYKFIKLYLKTSNENLPSALVRRFRTSKEKAAGIECLHEIRFSWCVNGWWVCSICYEAGCTLEQAEHHARSPAHLMMYLEEFAPEKAAIPRKLKHNPIQYYTELIKARDEQFEEQGEIPPEVFELDLAKEDVMVKLRIANLPQPPKETLTLTLGEEETVKRAIVRCTVCHQVIPCFRKNLNKVWNVHENSPEHRKAAAILGILKHLPCEEVVEDETDEPIALGFKWRQLNSTYYGPVCGKSFLLTTGTQHFCLLCQCEVRSIQDHFSSEYHVLRFLCTKKTQDMMLYVYQSGDVRRAKMSDVLSKIPLDNENYRRLKSDGIPSPILDLRSPEILDAMDPMPLLESFSFDMQCLCCGFCNEVLPIKIHDADNTKEIWNKHVTSAAHFDVISRKSCYRFYEEFFVPILPSVKTPPPALHGEWKVIEIDEKTSYKIQTHCDVGLEWIVEDQEAGEVVCTLCCRTYKKDSIDGINNHIRSYLHLNRYLHMSNRDLLAMVMTLPTEQAVLDLMLDWLHRTYLPVEPFEYNVETMLTSIHRNNWGQINVYSPEKATMIAKKTDIPVQTFYLPFFDPLSRDVYFTVAKILDKTAGPEENKVNLLNALRGSPFRIVYMDDTDNKISRRWLIRCMACQQTFSTTVETLVHDLYEVHLADGEHDRRIIAIEDFYANRYPYAEDTSTQTVKPFVQKDPSKKISWQWNNETQVYSFVLTVVGLDDMLERKSNVKSEHCVPDFFCRICVESIPRRNACLEAHVRSRKHIINFMQKYHPMTIYELDSMKADGKTERRIVANVLKDTKPSKEYPIPVFDPIGEQERLRQLAEAKQKESERQANLAESRKKAENERILREEHKKKILVQEKAAQERIRQQSQSREKEMREKHNKLKMEAELIKQKLKEEQEREIVASAERARQFAIVQAQKEKFGKIMRENRQSQLVSELAKLQSLKEKEEILLRERMEKELLAKRTQELLNKHHVKLPEPKLNLMPQHLTQPVMSMMNVPPPGYPNLSVPPPHYSNSVGPKPSFGTFVPTAGVMPTYPAGAEDMVISKGRSRTPSPRRRKRSRSRSRSRERRGRRRTRSRSPKSDWKLHGLREISPEAIRGGRSHRRSLSPVSISPPPDERHTPSKRRSMEKRPSLRGKTVNSDILNPAICHNRPGLVDYMCRQGAERIPPDEVPELFNKRATSIEGNLGVDGIYEVVCIDSPDLDTFYCSICGMWNTPNDMLKHLVTQEHKLAYLYRNQREYHQMVMTETVHSIRTTLLEELTKRLWKKEHVHPGVCARLRTLLNKATIWRIWPEHVQHLNHSWKGEDYRPVVNSTLVDVPAPVSREILGGFSSNLRSQPPHVMNVAQTTNVNLPPYFNPNMPPPGMGLPPHLMPAVAASLPTVTAPVVSKDVDMRRSPKEHRKRSRSRDRHSSSHRRESSRSRRSPPKRKRSRSPDERRRSRSREHRRSRDRYKKDDDPKIFDKDDLRWMSESARFLQSIGGQNTAIPTYASKTQPAVITLDDSPLKPQDASANERKILGLMYTMQQESEKYGHVDQNRLKQMSLEMGLTLSEKETEQLMATLLEKMKPALQKPNLNLAEFGINSQPPTFTRYQQQQYQQYLPIQQPYQQRTEDPALSRILSGIQGSLAQLKSDRLPSPIVKPMQYNFSRTDDFFKDTGMSLVYPEDLDELEREKKEKQERRQMASEKINATIEELKARAEQLKNADNEDDDWEGLESDLGQLFGIKNDTPSTTAASKEPEKEVEVKNTVRLGMPNTWAQPVPQPVKPQEPAVQTTAAQEAVPIAPGQKMALPRTMLPNGKAIPQAAPTAAVAVSQYNAPSTSIPAATLSTTTAGPAAVSSAPLQQQYYNYSQPPPMYSYGQPQQQMYNPAMYQQNYYHQAYQQTPQQYAPMYQPAAAQQPGVPGIQQPVVPGVQQPTVPGMQQQQQQQYYGGYNQPYRY